MKSKEFIRGLMAYIKVHYQHPDAVFLKEELKFKQGKYEYAYLAFEHSNIAEGITLHLSVYSKEMAHFSTENPLLCPQPLEPNNVVFVKNSIQCSADYHAPPITSYPHGDAVKLPETEAQAEPIYADVLQHLEQHYIPMIMAFAQANTNVLKQLVLFRYSFHYPALTALFIQQKNNLPPDAPEIQALFEHDDKILAKGFKGGLIFEDNDFDQAIKQRIMQAV